MATDGDQRSVAHVASRGGDAWWIVGKSVYDSVDDDARLALMIITAYLRFTKMVKVFAAYG